MWLLQQNFVQFDIIMLNSSSIDISLGKVPKKVGVKICGDYLKDGAGLKIITKHNCTRTVIQDGGNLSDMRRDRVVHK